MSASPSFVSVIQTPSASFGNVDGSTFKTIATAGANGTRIDALIASNTDTSNAYTLQLALQKSGVDYVIGEVQVPAGAGTNGTAKSVSVLNDTDIPAFSNTEGGALYIAAGISLRARVKTTVAGANSVQLCGMAGDY